VPLNKTRVTVISQHKQGRAAQHTNGRAALALELTAFDQEVKVAMQYAFGNVFICEDRKAARKIMEASDVSCRAISLQGDDYSPAGTLTGGSRGNGERLLARLAAYADAEAELLLLEVCPLLHLSTC
jgi:structural maintenance of chromosome 2